MKRRGCPGTVGYRQYANRQVSVLRDGMYKTGMGKRMELVGLSKFGLSLSTAVTSKSVWNTNVPTSKKQNRNRKKKLGVVKEVFNPKIDRAQECVISESKASLFNRASFRDTPGKTATKPTKM